MVGAQLSNEDQKVFYEELRTQNEDDEVVALSIETCKFPFTFDSQLMESTILLSLSAFELYVCSWIGTIYAYVIQSSKSLQGLFDCIKKEWISHTFNNSEDETEF